MEQSEYFESESLGLHEILGGNEFFEKVLSQMNSYVDGGKENNSDKKESYYDTKDFDTDNESAGDSQNGSPAEDQVSDIEDLSPFLEKKSLLIDQIKEIGEDVIEEIGGLESPFLEMIIGGDTKEEKLSDESIPILLDDISKKLSKTF